MCISEVISLLHIEDIFILFGVTDEQKCNMNISVEIRIIVVFRINEFCCNSDFNVQRSDMKK